MIMFDVKNGCYLQKSQRDGGKVRSIYCGKTGNTSRVQRPTKLDKIAGDRVNQINEKIKTLYEQGHGDRRISKILMEEDQIENPTGSRGGSGGPLCPSVIITQRHRMGVPNRVRQKPEPKPDWKAIATEKQSAIDELNRVLASTMDERDRYMDRLRECREQNYAMKYPSA